MQGRDSFDMQIYGMEGIPMEHVYAREHQIAGILTESKRPRTDMPIYAPPMPGPAYVPPPTYPGISQQYYQPPVVQQPPVTEHNPFLSFANSVTNGMLRNANEHLASVLVAPAQVQTDSVAKQPKSIMICKDETVSIEEKRAELSRYKK
jgi:hypothetical protein